MMPTPTTPASPVPARFRLGAIVASTVAVAGIGGSPALAAPANAPTFATVAQLQALAKTVRHPVYWLGPRAGFNYELTVLANGKIYVRYLPVGVKLGDSRPIYKTVGTYPVKGAAAQLRAGAKFLKRPLIKVGAKGIAVVSRPPTSVYVVFGTENYQVEIFTPSAKLSQAALRSVKPI